MGTSEIEGANVANLLNCKQAAFPMPYLGLPCAEKTLSELDWDPTVEKVIKQCDPW